MAIGALDQALWDALGRAADLPVAVLLGGAAQPLIAYDSYGLVDIKTDLPLLEASLVPIQTGENWWFPRGMANAIAAQASDLAMVDMIKIGGVTGWISAAGQAEAASLPLSSHSYIEASAHTMACSPTASWCEYLDLAGAVLTEPLIPDKGKITARGPGLGIEWDEKALHKYAFR
jgi:mandelate racemase